MFYGIDHFDLPGLAGGVAQALLGHAGEQILRHEALFAGVLGGPHIERDGVRFLQLDVELVAVSGEGLRERPEGLGGVDGHPGMLAHVIEIDLSGKTALVTGAGAGIGREIALWLARAGAAVTVNDKDGGRAEATVKEIAGDGGRATTAVANVRDPDSVERMVGSVVDAFGRLDIAVNNVGNTGGVI